MCTTKVGEFFNRLLVICLVEISYCDQLLSVIISMSFKLCNDRRQTILVPGTTWSDSAGPLLAIDLREQASSGSTIAAQVGRDSRRIKTCRQRWRMGAKKSAYRWISGRFLFEKNREIDKEINSNLLKIKTLNNEKTSISEKRMSINRKIDIVHNVSLSQ